MTRRFHDPHASVTLAALRDGPTTQPPTGTRRTTHAEKIFGRAN